METVTDFILGGSKITADDDRSHEIKRRLHLGRKVMTNLAYSKAETLLANRGPQVLVSVNYIHFKLCDAYLVSFVFKH